MPKPVFIDCDPGLDDLVALFCAVNMDEINVVGASSVCGNVPLENTTGNLARILALAGRGDIPFARGSALPLRRSLVTATYVHGETGTGSTTLPETDIVPVAAPAHSFLYEKAVEHSGELTLIALGPLTNLAKALMAFPDITRHVKELVIMGGGWKHGNITPAAEFNIYADAEAAHMVFSSGIPLTIVGLDATESVKFTPDVINEVCTGSPCGRVIRQAMDDACAYYRGRDGIDGGAFIHDMMAVICAARPELFESNNCHVDIELNGEHTYGRTVCDFTGVSGKAPNARVAMRAHEREYLDAVKEIMKKIR